MVTDNTYIFITPLIYNIKISILITIFNFKKFISHCIESLPKQDISEDNYEIIVIDDGSTNNFLI